MSAVNVKTSLAYARLWHHVDATGMSVGRLATRLSTVLQGKHKPIFTPGVDCGDYIVVTNAERVTFTGRSLEQKAFYHHTGYPGGLRRTPLKNLMESDPTAVLRRAVSGMLPKNGLREKRLGRLKIYPSSTHPYGANIAKSYEGMAQREADPHAIL